MSRLSVATHGFRGSSEFRLSVATRGFRPFGGIRKIYEAVVESLELSELEASSARLVASLLEDLQFRETITSWTSKDWQEIAAFEVIINRVRKFIVER